jgi:hypothetical protein
MKKLNFYWIIAALVVLRMSNIQADNTYQNGYNSNESTEVASSSTAVSSDNLIAHGGVSGRWIR